jgi:hypothetical protein
MVTKLRQWVDRNDRTNRSFFQLGYRFLRRWWNLPNPA